MGLDDPTVKMSKSRALVNRGHSIGVVDAPEAISQSVRRAVTDSRTSVDVQDAGAGVRNLLNIYKSFSGESDHELSARFDGRGYGVLKNGLTALLVDVLAPIRSDYQRILAERSYLDDVLGDGGQRALRISIEKVERVKEILGLQG